MERVIYEVRPHFYLAVAFYAVAISHASWLMILSGMILGFCGFTVIQFRRKYRRHQAWLRQSRLAANKSLKVKWT